MGCVATMKRADQRPAWKISHSCPQLSARKKNVQFTGRMAKEVVRNGWT